MEKVGKIFRQTLVDNIKDGVSNSKSTFLVSYSAVSASRMDTLRKELKRIGARVYVSKNRLAKIALKELEPQLSEHLEGQTAFVWSDADSAMVSKALVDFAKECEGVAVRAGLLDGALLGKADIKRLSDLPSREVLQSQLLAMIQAPVTRLLGVFNGKSRELLSILKQYSEQKGGK